MNFTQQHRYTTSIPAPLVPDPCRIIRSAGRTIQLSTLEPLYLYLTDLRSITITTNTCTILRIPKP